MRIGWWAVLGVAVVVGTVMVVTAEVAAQPGTRVIVVAAGRKAGNPKVWIECCIRHEARSFGKQCGRIPLSGWLQNALAIF